jgi:hypothetical protein
MSVIGARFYWLFISVLSGFLLTAAGVVPMREPGITVPASIVYYFIGAIFFALTSAVALLTRRTFS